MSEITHSHTKKIVIIALLIAIEIILTRIAVIQIPPGAAIVRISLGFICIAIIAMLYGPVFSAIAAVIADVVGVMLLPTGGVFFPGFTISALLIGIIYGLLLHKQPVPFWKVCVTAGIVTIGINFFIDTLWISIIPHWGYIVSGDTSIDGELFERVGTAYIALIPVRIIRTAIMLPLQIVCIRFITGKRFAKILHLKREEGDL
ncbi:MAG: folate family ECF transporter S component [Defluviitaleaceae bacterium]|nr:folate family ECF transporter S component [Defluviitaleaceae bacterium]